MHNKRPDQYEYEPSPVSTDTSLSPDTIVVALSNLALLIGFSLLIGRVALFILGIAL